MRLLAWLAAAWCGMPLAARGGESPARPERRISLEEVVALAVEHNLRLAAERLSPQQADTVVIERIALFDPFVYGDYTREKSRQQSSTGLFGNRQQLSDATVGLQKLFPPGTVADLHLATRREWSDFPFAAVNPAYENEFGWSITQPILRGFGTRVNTAGIATAQNERRIATQQLRSVALDVVAEAQKTYWELVYAIRNKALLQRSLERAVSLQRDILARVEAGVLGERDPSVAQAQAEVALREEDIVVAGDLIRDAEEALKVITDLAADPQVWDQALVPTTEPPTDVPPLEPQRAVDTALAHRPDYQQAKLSIENRDIDVMVGRNELLPRLDASFGINNTGLSAASHQARRDLGTFDYYHWVLGIRLEYPLGNRAARARYRRARLQRRQAFISLKGLERQIHLQVRNAIRQVGTDVERLRAAQATVAAERERVRAEEIRFTEAQVGTSQDVLDAQADLAEAERRSLRALIDLNQSLVDVERVAGTLLEASGVSFQEE
ncbi:MAG: TolC family protein [Candidatus Brocadiia bacterium]